MALKQPRVYVLLTFDVDAETLWTSRAAEGETVGPVMLSQGTYGPKTALPRILALLARHGVEATFFIPGWVAQTYPAMCTEILAKGHEIGHHGWLHERPDRISAQEERRTFAKTIKTMERITGRRPLGYRAPAWELSDITLELLEEHGLVYSSNMMDQDRPYQHLKNNRPSGIYELPVSWSLDDAALFMYGLSTPGWPIMNPRTVAQMWKDEFDGFYNEGNGLAYVLTMHPQIIGRPSRLMALENLIQHIQKFPDAVFLKGNEAVEVWKRFN